MKNLITILAAVAIGAMATGCNRDASQQVEYLSHRVDSYSKLTKDLQSEKAVLTNQVGVLQIEKTNLEIQIGLLQMDRTALTNQTQTLQSALVTQIAAQETNFIGLSNLLVSLRAEKTTLEKRAATLQTENSTLKSRVSALSAKPTNSVPAQVAKTNITSRTSGVQINLVPTAATTGNTSGSLFTTNGIAGGMPALFVNKLSKKIAIYIKGGGSTITLNLSPGMRTFGLRPGQYVYTSAVENGPSDTVEHTFTVEKELIHFYDGFGSNPGGVEFQNKGN